ncbi:MAG TPA: hypothetical protein IAB66_10065 [Candidatus Caccousia avistercoris]|nr:hypothetical protein [Candidatus Caccousia avistercoris]
MLTALHNYDVFPKVLRAGVETEITIEPLGRHAALTPGSLCQVELLPTEEGSPVYYPERPNHTLYPVTAGSRGELRLRCLLPSEQEYYLRFEGPKGRVQLSLYAVKEDLAGRYPFMGDLHVHSFRSDGKEAPEIVAANYRKFGYDFMAITDHRRYYPSLEAIRAFAGVDSDFLLTPGEEVHLPGTDVHIINFGGDYSINALVERDDTPDAQGQPRARQGAVPPPVLSREEYDRQVAALAEELALPEGVEKISFAVCEWAFRQIRQANGLGVFCHPYWISDVYQVPESFVECMMERRPFDAFEVLGGELYFEQNGFQAIRYYEDMAKGRVYPIVGSTDSHGSVNNPAGTVARTLVFSPENTREALIGSIRDRYTAAVDGMDTKLRLVGESRLVRYGNFLLKHYFPLHDDLCHEEGRLMKEYACGNREVREALEQRAPRMRALRRKYFAF